MRKPSACPIDYFNNFLNNLLIKGNDINAWLKNSDVVSIKSLCMLIADHEYTQFNIILYSTTMIIFLIVQIHSALCCNVFKVITTPKSPPRGVELDYTAAEDFGMGIWTRFNPSVYRFDRPMEELEKMLIFYQANTERSEFYTTYSIKFDQKSQTMYHDVYLYIGGVFQIFSLPLEAHISVQRWIFLYLCRNAAANSYSIFLYYATDREYTQMGTGINGIWRPFNKHYYQIGQTVVSPNQFEPSVIYSLSVFRGEISDLYFQNSAGQFLENIPSFLDFIENLICIVPDPCPAKNSVWLLQSVTSFGGHEFIIKKQDAKQSRYMISGWARVRPLDQETQYKSLLMRATVNPNYMQNQNQGDRAFYLEYRQNIQEELNGFYFSTYSLNPDPTSTAYASTPDDEWLEMDAFYEAALINWHYFSFQFGLSDPVLNAKLEIFYAHQQISKVKYFPSRNQLPDQTFLFLIGGDKFSQDGMFRGEVSHLSFEYCFKTDQTPIKPCHYSCAQCLGPTKQDCLACVDPTITNRQLIPSTGQCDCRKEYLDREGEAICADANQVFDFVQIEQVEEKSSCRLGEFSVAGEFCLPCPSQIQEEGFYCADCWTSPKTWYLSPKCTIDFTQIAHSPENSFIKTFREQGLQIFFAIDKGSRSLATCEGCTLDYSQGGLVVCKNCYKKNAQGQCVKYSDNCRQCQDSTETCLVCADKYTWTEQGCLPCPSNCETCLRETNSNGQQEIRCTKCSINFGIRKGSCVQCGQYCAICEEQAFRATFLMKCYTCQDPYLYYLSLDTKNCLENRIPNCLIAMHATLNNGFYEVSANILVTPTALQYYFTICMRCKPGFINNHVSQSCEPSTDFDESIRFVTETINLGRNKNPALSQKCGVNCSKCIPNDFNFCLACNFGYYSHKYSGNCSPCHRFLNCRTCVQYNERYQDEWKWQIRGNYYYNIGQGVGYPPFVLADTPNRIDNIVKCTSCKIGYILYKGKCVKGCGQTCKKCVVVDFKSECIECKSTIQGQLQSSENGECLSCPFNCRACYLQAQEEISLVNPYFQLSESDLKLFSNVCLKKFDVPDTYYNWELAQFTECQVLKKPCFNRAKINLSAYCSDQMFEAQENLAPNKDQFQKVNLRLSRVFNQRQELSFPQIDNTEFYLVMNQKQVKALEITLNLIYDDTGHCQIHPVSSVVQALRRNIYTLQSVELNIKGNKNFVVSWTSNISLINFEVLRLSNLRLSFEDSANLISNSLVPQEVHFENILIETQSNQWKKISFLLNNAKLLSLLNVSLVNLRLEGPQALFNYDFDKQPNSDVKLKVSNFQLSGCSLSKITIFEIKLSKIEDLLSSNHLPIFDFTSLNIQTSQFSESSLISTYFDGQQIQRPDIEVRIQSLILRQVNVEASELFKLSGIKSSLSSVFVDRSTVSYSRLFVIDSFSLEYFSITNNQILRGSQLIFSKNLGNAGFASKLNDFTVQQNEYIEANAIMLFQQPEQVLTIHALVLKSNHLILAEQQPVLAQMSLIYVEARDVQIAKSKIIRGKGFPELTLLNLETVLIDDFSVTLESGASTAVLHSSLECIRASLNELQFTTFMFMYAIKKITINRLQVTSLLAINQPLVVIRSSEKFMLTHQEEITVSNSTFSQNVLISTKLEIEQSILLVQSEQAQTIRFLNTQFRSNHLHSYFTDITLKSASTVIISSPKSQVILHSLQIQFCLVTNNKGANFLVQADTVILQDSKFQNLNQVTYQDLKKNLVWGTVDSLFYQESLRSFFKIYSQGGAGYLSAAKIIMDKVTVLQAAASVGGAFYLELKNGGVVKVHNSSFEDTQAMLNQQENSAGGSLFINSASSNLELTISDTQFENSFSKSYGGGLYIKLSTSLPGKISIKTCIVRNSYSLLGSFLYVVQKSGQISDTFDIMVADSILDNNRPELFYSQIVGASDEIIEQFKSSYFIEVHGGKVVFKDNKIKSLSLNGLLKAYKFYDILLTNFAVSNVELLSTPLLKLTPQRLHRGSIIIDGVNVQNFSAIGQSQSKVDPPPILKEKGFFCLKSLQKPEDLLYFYDENFQSLNSKYFFQQLLLSQNPLQGLILIEELTSAWELEVKNLRLKYVNCTSCTGGLLNVQGIGLLQSQTTIKIIKSTFWENQCGQKGCLYIHNEPRFENERLLSKLDKIYEIESTLEISTCYFTRNKAAYGGAVYLKGLTALIIASTFNSNQATVAGGAIYFSQTENKETLMLIEIELTNNDASYGGALYMSNYTLNKPELFDLLFYGNYAKDFGDNIVQPPYKLTVSLNAGKDVLEVEPISTDLNARIDMVALPSLQKSLVLFPSGQPLNNYRYFDPKAKTFTEANLTLRIIPLSTQGARMKQLNETQCTLDSRVVDLSDPRGHLAGGFQPNFTSLDSVPFNQTSQDYNFDNLAVKFSPELRQRMALQLRFRCDSVKIPIFDHNPPYLLKEYSTNYSLYLNVQTFFCQQGEFMRVELDVTLCELCDSSQDLYSVTPGQPCKIRDQVTMKKVTSARFHWQYAKGYWRPNDNSDQVVHCRNLPENCAGGWESGDASCYQGHIGALCEQCDLYDLRGDGAFSLSEAFKCGSCAQVEGNVVKLVLISIWTLLSITLSVNSTIESNLLASLGNKFKQIGMQVNPRARIGGILIKVFTNYMQIVSTIATFQLSLPSALTSTVTSFGSPIMAMSYSLDCSLVQLAQRAGIEILYFRVIWGFIMPCFYVIIYFLIQASLIVAKLHKPKVGIISTTLIFMYIYLQPTLIGGLASLVSFREISGIAWVQGNVSYRYNTATHSAWIWYFIIPLLMFLTFLLPFYMLITLYRYRKSLDDFKVRSDWGYLYNEYSGQSYFWEIVKLYQKGLIIIFLTYYEDLVVVKGALIFIIVFLYQLLSKVTNPYQLKFLNRFDEESSIVCGLSIVMGITIYTANITDNQEIIWPFYVVLIVGNSIFILRVLLEVVRSQMDQNQEVLDKLRDKVNEKYPWLKEVQILQLYILQNRERQQRRVAARFKQVKAYLRQEVQKLKELMSNQESNSDQKSQEGGSIKVRSKQKQQSSDQKSQELKGDYKKAHDLSFELKEDQGSCQVLPIKTSATLAMRSELNLPLQVSNANIMMSEESAERQFLKTNQNAQSQHGQAMKQPPAKGEAEKNDYSTIQLRVPFHNFSGHEITMNPQFPSSGEVDNSEFQADDNFEQKFNQDS